MQQLLRSLMLFGAAVVVNTGSVVVQQRSAFLTRWFGPAGWTVHLALIAPPWLIFLASLPHLARSTRWPLPRLLRPAGDGCLLAAVAIWALAFAQLGPVRTANGDQFGRARPIHLRSGVFRLLANPMYDSYGLAFVGAALRSSNAVFLPMAGASYLLLNGLEARAENAAVSEA